MDNFSVILVEMNVELVFRKEMQFITKILLTKAIFISPWPKANKIISYEIGISNGIAQRNNIGISNGIAVFLWAIPFEIPVGVIKYAGGPLGKICGGGS